MHMRIVYRLASNTVWDSESGAQVNQEPLYSENIDVFQTHPIRVIERAYISSSSGLTEDWPILIRTWMRIYVCAPLWPSLDYRPIL